MEQDPKTLAQASLDRTGEALLSRDFDMFRACFTLPTSIATESGIKLLRSEADLRTTFHAVTEHYRALRLTRLDRQVDVALQDGPDVIRFSHLSKLYSGDTLVQAPYPCCSVLVRGDAGWKVADSQYTIGAGTAQSNALLSAGVTLDAVDADATMAVFQNNLNLVTEAYLGGDFALLCRQFKLPLFVQGSDGSLVFATREELRIDFDRYMTKFRVLQISDIVRTVKTAEQVGARRMHGSFRTYFLRGHQLVIPSYTSAMTLEQGDDHVWRVTTIMHPMGHPTLDGLMRTASGV